MYDGIWASTKFRYEVGMQDVYTNEIYWFQKGVYILSNPNLTHNNSDKQIQYTLRDKWAKLEGKEATLTSTMEIPVGSNAVKAVQGILDLDNGTGNPIDPIPFNFDPLLKDIVTPYTIVKDVGTNLSELILELSSVLNAEIYYNEYGELTALPISETMQDTKKQIVWQYNEEELQNEEISHQISYIMEEYINEVHITGTNVNGNNVYGTAVNNNVESPFSISRIGRRIETLEDSMIATEEEANDRAIYELRKTTIRQTAISKQVLFNPLLTANSLIATRNEEQGIVKLIIQSISYSMPSGIVTVGLSDLDNIAEISPLYIKGGPFLLLENSEFFVLLEDYSLIRLESGN